MAHFVKLDENNVVVDGTVVHNSVINDLPFPESEPVGQAFLQKCGLEGRWVQTSYNNNFRKQYAGVGYTYDEANDVFIKPNAYGPSWTLDENFDWQPPVPRPESGEYYWDESQVNWVILS